MLSECYACRIECVKPGTILAGGQGRHAASPFAMPPIPGRLVHGSGTGTKIRRVQVPFVPAPAPRSRSAFPITDTELRLMARAAIMGDSSCPVKG